MMSIAISSPAYVRYLRPVQCKCKGIWSCLNYAYGKKSVPLDLANSCKLQQSLQQSSRWCLTVMRLDRKHSIFLSDQIKQPTSVVYSIYKTSYCIPLFCCGNWQFLSWYRMNKMIVFLY